jgi:hypothetical protein
MQPEKCLVCNRDVDINHERIQTINGPICMGCEGAVIPVWKLSIVGETGGFYESSPTDMIDMIEDMSDGDSYKIVKSKMEAVKFHNLPEFEGF